MNLTILHTGPLGVNTYVIENNGQAIVIDPADAAPVTECLQKSGALLSAVLLTHGHFDHILGAPALQQAGAKVYIHEKDAAALYDDAVSLCTMSWIKAEHCHADVLLSGEETLDLIGLSIQVIATPGHTPGGVSYLIEKEGLLFSGDTLFRMSIGRSDLPGGEGQILYESVLYSLFPLKGDYRVLPGHMEETTLDFERKNNPFFKRGGAERW